RSPRADSRTWSSLGSALAAGAQRYASPTGSGTACTSASPCSISQAITGAAIGDEVTLASGDYPVSATIQTPAELTIHGIAGQPRPRIILTADAGIRIVDASILRYVGIEQQSDDTALYMSDSSLADQVQVTGPWGAMIESGATIRDSIVVATGANAVALETATTGAPTTANYRN